jgi:hypothetical protein
MRAIGDNTQRAFDNQFRVQAAQMTTGLQVAGQIEQYRMNDAKLFELGQTMRIRDQEYQWEKANQAFAEKLRPLQFQAQQYDLQNKFRIQAEQRMSPFLTDIKGEFQQLIMDRPELAAEAQSIYARSIDGVLNKTLSDPNADIASELEKNKASMRSWIDKSRSAKVFEMEPNKAPRPTIDPTSPSRSSMLASSAYNPMIKVEKADRERSLSKDETSRAAAIYSSFGGVPQDFIREYDPIYKESNDSSYRLMVTTGKITSQEAFDRLSVSQQESVLSAVKKEQDRLLMSDTIKSYRLELNDIMDSNKDGSYSTRIAEMRQRLVSMNEQYAKDYLGVNFDAEQVKDGRQAPDSEGILNEVSMSSGAAAITGQSRADTSMLQSDFDSVAKIIKKISPAGDSEIESVRQKYLQNPDSVTGKDIEKLTYKVGAGQIDGLANTDWFKAYIEENNLSVTIDGEYTQQSKVGRAMQVLTTQSRPFLEDAFSSSSKRVFTNARDRLWTNEEKNEARKVLKSELPNILFDYLNQSR